MEEAAPFVLVMPSDPRLLGLARSFVEQVCRYHSWDSCSTEALVLAAHEAMQNVLRHAHATRPAAVVEVRMRCLESGGLEICLVDQGEPFDIARVPHLEPGELRFGGRGVYLIRRLVDELHSEPRQPHGNILRLVKYPPWTGTSRSG
ncbi:MAG: ATP-binding protein [Gemmataceae bacterium]|nr:ATP-binding protein [Gemmataceae bacterium]